MERPLKIKSPTITIGNRKILPPLTLSLKSGDCLYVEGPNGVGKTALLETIAGLRVMEGYSPPPSLLFCGDKPGVKARLSAFANLEFYACLEGANHPQDTLGALAYFSLKPNRRGFELSGGQRQRLALARLYLTKKRLWLLDEPVANLDRSGEALLLGLIKKHRRGGGWVIMSGHRGRPPPGSVRLSLDRLSSGRRRENEAERREG